MNEKVYFNKDTVIIYNDDFLITDCIKENSVDLIVTSPSFGLDRKSSNRCNKELIKNAIF